MTGDVSPDQPTERDEAHQALYEAVRLMETGEHWAALKEALDALHAGDDHLKLLLLCICLTAGLREKLHFWAVGRSQMGKSRLETVMEELFPNVEVYDTQSPLFLLYQVRDQGSKYLRGKIVVIEEVLDNPAVWGLIKRLTSADKDHVRHGTVMKGRPLELEVDGLPVILSNSVETSVDEQINNRFLIGNVDESPRQDERVRTFQEEEAEGLVLEERRAKVDRGRLVLGQILAERDVDVLLPSARFIDFPMTAERVNRKKFYRLAKVVAYANRYRRRRLGGGRDEGPLVATEEDVRFAYGLWLGVQAYQQTQLDETGARILREVPADGYEPLQTLLDRLERKGVNPSTARKRLKRLYEQNLVDERKTREVDYDERTGSQKVIPGWSLEVKRMVGDLEWVSAFPRGPLAEGRLPSPIRESSAARGRYYRTWARSLVERGDVAFPTISTSMEGDSEGDFHISTNSTEHYRKEDVEAWAAEMADYVLGRVTEAENSALESVRRTAPVETGEGAVPNRADADVRPALEGVGGENRNSESGNSDSQHGRHQGGGPSDE